MVLLEDKIRPLLKLSVKILQFTVSTKGNGIQM